MASTISTLAEVFLIDSRTSKGAFQLPNASSNIGRKITIKDAFGTFANSTVQLLLSSTDTFEDGAVARNFSTNNAALSFFATSNQWISYSSNTSGGYSTDRTGFNCNAPRFGIDVNGVANFSTINSVRVNPSTSNMWVTVGEGTFSILYSYNGIHWSAADNPAGGFSANGLCVSYGNNMWIAGGIDSTASNQLKYSYDGRNWSNVTNGGFNIGGVGCYDVKWNGRMWVAVGGSSTSNGTIKYSYDGVNWSNANQGFPENTGTANIGTGVAWNGTMWVASGWRSSATYTNGFMYSYDGINWSFAGSVQDSGSGYTGSAQTSGLVWDGHRWLAATTTGAGFVVDMLKYSTNGINWSNGIFGTNIAHHLSGILYNGKGYWFGAWDATISLLYSPDGFTNFITVDTLNGVDYQYTSPVYNGNLFVNPQRSANGSNYRIVYSYDGFTWLPTTGVGFTGGQGGMCTAFSSNLTVFNQSNFRMYEQAIWTPTVSTNNFFCMPSSLLINNTLLVDEALNGVQVNTNVPQNAFALDVNGPMRYAFLPSTVSAGGTLTITASNFFGVSYNITTAGTFTFSFPSTQPTTNIGKFYTFRNSTATNMTVTISGATGIPSPMPLSSFTTTMIVVATGSSYALFSYQ